MDNIKSLIDKISAGSISPADLSPDLQELVLAYCRQKTEPKTEPKKHAWNSGPSADDVIYTDSFFTQNSSLLSQIPQHPWPFLHGLSFPNSQANLNLFNPYTKANFSDEYKNFSDKCPTDKHTAPLDKWNAVPKSTRVLDESLNPAGFDTPLRAGYLLEAPSTHLIKPDSRSISVDERTGCESLTPNGISEEHTKREVSFPHFRSESFRRPEDYLRFSTAANNLPQSTNLQGTLSVPIIESGISPPERLMGVSTGNVFEGFQSGEIQPASNNASSVVSFKSRTQVPTFSAPSQTTGGEGRPAVITDSGKRKLTDVDTLIGPGQDPGAHVDSFRELSLCMVREGATKKLRMLKNNTNVQKVREHDTRHMQELESYCRHVEKRKAEFETTLHQLQKENKELKRLFQERNCARGETGGINTGHDLAPLQTECNVSANMSEGSHMVVCNGEDTSRCMDNLSAVIESVEVQRNRVEFNEQIQKYT